MTCVPQLANIPAAAQAVVLRQMTAEKLRGKNIQLATFSRRTQQRILGKEPPTASKVKTSWKKRLDDKAREEALAKDQPYMQAVELRARVAEAEIQRLREQLVTRAWKAESEANQRAHKSEAEAMELRLLQDLAHRVDEREKKELQKVGQDARKYEADATDLRLLRDLALQVRERDKIDLQKADQDAHKAQAVHKAKDDNNRAQVARMSVRCQSFVLRPWRRRAMDQAGRRLVSYLTPPMIQQLTHQLHRRVTYVKVAVRTGRSIPGRLKTQAHPLCATCLL
jgi:hypothetical protein